MTIRSRKKHYCQNVVTQRYLSITNRQIYLDVNEKQAKADLEKLWTPNKTWQTLINSILDKN